MSLYKDATLAMIPTAYKDGKLYSVRPTDGSGDFTFSRGSNLAATRVASSGYIEKGRENHILQSNAITTSPWASTRILSEAQGHTGYDGSNNAWLIVPNTDNNTHFKLQSVSTTSGVNTISVYVKSAGYDYFSIRDDSSGSSYARFDLSIGVTSITGSNAITSKIESVGGDWWRCSLTYQETATGNIIFYVNNAYDYASVYAGDGVSGIYFMNAQVEQGLVATDYIETTTTSVSAGILEDMPRLDYSGGASCPALLLEPQRSNLVDDYSGYTWDAFNGAAISFTGTQQSPEGLNNAVTWTFGGTSGEVVQRSSISISNTTAYTISGYFKLTSGTLTSGSNQLKGLDGLTGGSVSLNTLTSEWQRLSFSVTSSSTSGRVQLRCDNSATIQVYGLQLEAGSYETSIIPTYGASVTRSVDVFTRTGISSLINSQEGTFFVDMAALSSNTGTSLLSLSDGSATNNIYIGFTSTTNQISAVIYANGSAQAAINIFSYDVKQSNKIAFSYKTDEVKLFINGSLVGTDTTATMPNANTLNEFSSDFGQGSFKLAARLNQSIIFPTALTDSECIALTTL